MSFLRQIISMKSKKIFPPRHRSRLVIVYTKCCHSFQTPPVPPFHSWLRLHLFRCTHTHIQAFICIILWLSVDLCTYAPFDGAYTETCINNNMGWQWFVRMFVLFLFFFSRTNVYLLRKDHSLAHSSTHTHRHTTYFRYYFIHFRIHFSIY